MSIPRRPPLATMVIPRLNDSSVKLAFVSITNEVVSLPIPNIIGDKNPKNE